MNQPPLNPDSTLITDELTRVAEALHGYDCPDDPEPGEWCTCDGDTYYRMAEVALEAAAQPRTITTIAELEALPFESIVLDADDDHLMLVADGEGGSYWVRFDDTDFYLTSDIALPARVLWVPTEGGGK